MSSDTIIKVICQCGITWKIPFGKGVGLFTYSFQCGGPKGCRKYLSIDAQDNEVTGVSGAKKWWIEKEAYLEEINVKALPQIGGFTV